MAKKNSTKTATKEAMAASEPRLQQFKGWKGINLSGKPEGWTPEDPDDNQTDLPMNFFMVQDNVVPTKTGSLETRNGLIQITDFKVDDNLGETNGFKGLAIVNDGWIYANLRAAMPPVGDGINHENDEKICQRKIDESGLSIGKWEPVMLDSSLTKHNFLRFTDLGFYCVDGGCRMIALGIDNDTGDNAICMSHDIIEPGNPANHNGNMLVKSRKVPNPFEPGAWDWDDWATEMNPWFRVTCVGDVEYDGLDDTVATSDITFYFSFTNEYGTSMMCPASKAVTVTTKIGMTQFDFDNYIKISGDVDGLQIGPSFLENTFWYKDIASGQYICKVKGVDIYYTINNYTYPVYAGHAVVTQEYNRDSQPSRALGHWEFNFYGSLNGTYDYGGQSTAVPDENTTGGPDATHMTQIDGRMYFYGCTKHPERLYIGGNAGHEASIARGYGGAFVDINPGTGLEIKAVHKFKTASGSNIVTILCSSPNSGKSKRFNLLETTISLTQEDAERTYIVEEVENVVGCTSFYGSGVWEDGIYYTDRYGIMVTTQQMEYSSQMRSVSISDQISPIFTDRLAVDMENAMLTYINGTMYLALAKPGGDELERIIFCYDMQVKAWYTISLPQFSDEKIIHIFPIDYKGWTEGLGIMTESSIYLLPTTGEYDAENYEDFVSCLETGEMSTTIPPTSTAYLCQLEFDFDWFIGNLEITVEGVDYYGRHVKAVKRISSRNLNRNFQEWMRIDQIMRSYSITIKGAARYKLITIVAKVYLKSKKVNLVYGFDNTISYRNRFGATKFVHRKVNSYNNLKECILP